MNYKNEYQKEVGSLTLSAEFKEALKQKCLEQLGKPQDDGRTKVIEIDGGKEDIYSKLKVYKYVSMAACLLAIISTIGVFSIMGSQFKTKSDNNAADDSISVNEMIDDEDINSIADGNGLYPFLSPDDAETPDAANANYDMADVPFESEDDLPVDESSEVEPMDNSAVDEEAFNNDLLAKLSDYTGDYVTTDYVLGLQNSTSGSVSNIYADVSAINRDSGESKAIDEPDYRKSLNFYDVLAGGLKKESELLGATLVKYTVDGVRSERGIYTEYDVTINYDYLNQTSCKVRARVWAKGNSEHQIQGMPMYEEGDVVITSLVANPDGSVSVLDELLYDVYDLSGTDIAYHRVYSSVNPGFTDMGLLGVEQEFITTAENNPVKYVHKSSTKELTRYIRRKIVGENYMFADLEKLGQISRGEAEFEIPEQPAPEDQDFPENQDIPDNSGDDENQPDGGEQPQEELIDKLRISTADDKLIITSAGEVIQLYSAQTSGYLSSKFKNSASGTTSSLDKSNVMFVGGKLIFNSPNAFGGELIGIEISGAGCSLDIAFNGAKVGDSLEQVKELLGITKNLAPNSKVTYQGDTIKAILTFQYDALVKIEIS